MKLTKIPPVIIEIAKLGIKYSKFSSINPTEEFKIKGMKLVANIILTIVITQKMIEILIEDLVESSKIHFEQIPIPILISSSLIS
jgi:hypothetical protein